MKKYLFILSLFIAVSCLGQNGNCEFADVTAMNSFSPSQDYHCKKAFVVANNTHYNWNGTVWVLSDSSLASEDQVIQGREGKITFDDGTGLTIQKDNGAIVEMFKFLDGGFAAFGGDYSLSSVPDGLSTDSLLLISNGGIRKGPSSILQDGLRPEWFGANGDDALDDTAAWQSMSDFAKANDFKNIILSPTAEYYLTSVDFIGFDANYNTPELMHQFNIYGQGARIRQTYTASEPAVLYFQNTNNVKIHDVFFIGDNTPVTYTDDNYLVQFRQGAYGTIEGCTFMQVYSHAIVNDTPDQGTNPEKYGMNVYDNVFHSMTELDIQQSYIKMINGSEYNNIHDNYFTNGISAIRSIGGANDMIVNNRMLMMETTLNDTDDSGFTFGIIYYEFGGNSGKVQIDGNKLNHNDRGNFGVVIKNDPTKPKNIVMITNHESLVTGESGAFTQIYLEECDDAIIHTANLRPRVNTGSPIVHLVNSDRVQIDKTYFGDGGFALQLDNASVTWGENYIVDCGFVDNNSSGGSVKFTTYGAENTFADHPTAQGANAIRTGVSLAQNSVYALTGDNVNYSIR